MDDDAIILGTALPDSPIPDTPELIPRDPAEREYLRLPWVRAEIERTLGISLEVSGRRRTSTVSILKRRTNPHIAIIGLSGSGKSRSASHLLSHTSSDPQENSAIICDPKLEVCLGAVNIAKAAGFGPKQITMLGPGFPNVPGLNPWLIPGLAVGEIADLLADLLLAVVGSYPRLRVILINLLIVAGCLPGLSLVEAIAAIEDDTVLADLVSRPAPWGLTDADRLAYTQAQRYFVSSFLQWSKRERLAALAPLQTRTADLSRSLMWMGLFGAEANTIDFAGMWEADEPRLLVVHLDHARLGATTGITLLTGIILGLALQTAHRVRPKRQVWLYLDELGLASSFVAGLVKQALLIGRGLQLACTCCLQSYELVDPDLSTALRSQPATQLYFNLSYTDAVKVAQSIAVGAEPVLKRAIVSKADPKTRPITRSFPVRDAHNRPVGFSPQEWERFKNADRVHLDSAAHLYEAANAGDITRLYVEIDGKPMELRRFLSGCCEGDFWFLGPSPLELVISFPAPVLSHVEFMSESDQIKAWARCLSHLSKQNALLRTDQEVTLLRFLDVPDPPVLGEGDPFVQACLHANGRSHCEIVAMIERRQRSIGTTSPTTTEDALDEEAPSDGSIF